MSGEISPTLLLALLFLFLAIRRLIEDLLELEDRGRERLHERQKLIAAEIGKLSRNMQARRAYGTSRRLPVSGPDGTGRNAAAGVRE